LVCIMPASDLTAADVAKLTVPKLKEALAARGLDISGLKAALSERLLAAISKPAAAAEPEPEPAPEPAPQPVVGNKRKAQDAVAPDADKAPAKRAAAADEPPPPAPEEEAPPPPPAPEEEAPPPPPAPEEEAPPPPPPAPEVAKAPPLKPLLKPPSKPGLTLEGWCGLEERHSELIGLGPWMASFE